MYPFFEYLTGCGELAGKPLNPEIGEGFVQLDYMPMVEPFMHPTMLFQPQNYYDDSLAYNKQIRAAMSLAINTSGAFTEYLSTVQTALTGFTRHPYYAMTNGYLYYVHSGQSYPIILGDIVADRDLLVLVPLDTAHGEINKYRPELSASLKKIAYLTSDLEPATLTSNLKAFIQNFLSEKFFQAQYEGRQKPQVVLWCRGLQSKWCLLP